MSRHISTVIDRSSNTVYDYAADPANLPAWAAGLASGIDHVDGEWVAQSPMGRVVLWMTPQNSFGVLDHWVTTPDGATTYNPLRVLEHGDRAEVVFTLRRRDGMSDDEFEADAAAIEADLATLRSILEDR